MEFETAPKHHFRKMQKKCTKYWNLEQAQDVLNPLFLHFSSRDVSKIDLACNFLPTSCAKYSNLRWPGAQPGGCPGAGWGLGPGQNKVMGCSRGLPKLVHGWHGAATGLPWGWFRIALDGRLEAEFGQSGLGPVSIQTTKPMVSINSPSPIAGKLSRTAMSDNPDKRSLSTCLHPSLFHRKLNLAPRP